MGTAYSEPIPEIGFNYICIYFRQPNLCRIMHATCHIIQAITNIVKELDNHNPDINVELKHGATQLTLPGEPFSNQNKSCNIGIIFTKRLLEAMFSLGYDFMFSTDLSRTLNRGSLFFKKTPVTCNGRDAMELVSISPEGTDTLVLMNHNDLIKVTVRNAISCSWHWGILVEAELSGEGGEVMHKFQVNGNPWSSKDEEVLKAKKMLLEIIAQMDEIGYRLRASVNIEGSTDSLFFTQTDVDNDVINPEYALFSISNLNQLDLIDFEEDVVLLIKDTIQRFFQKTPPAMRQNKRSTEFVLKRNPFCCSGEESVMTSQLICRILEVFSFKGWKVLATLSLSRSSTNKSMFILERAPIPESPIIFGCISLNEKAKIRIINFPSDIGDAFKKIINTQYKPGVISEKERSLDCHQIHLDGEPWTHSSSYGLHARSLMVLLLRAANCRGWNMIASADVSSKYNKDHNSEVPYPVDVHSWFFSYGGHKYNLKRH